MQLRIEERSVARVASQGRDPVQPINDPVPYHNHIKGGAPKVSSDLSTTTFRPAERKARATECSGIDPPQSSSGSGVNPPAATEEPPQQGRESRSASTGSSFCLVERPLSSELDQRFRSPTGDTEESSTEESRHTHPCAALDERLEVKNTFKPTFHDKRLEEKLVQRRALAIGDSSDSSKEGDDLEYGLLPDLQAANFVAPSVDVHQIADGNTPPDSPLESPREPLPPPEHPPETPRASSRPPDIPSRKAVKKDDTPKSKEQISRELLLHDELVKKHGPGTYWTGSIKELEESKAESQRLFAEFRERHPENRERGRSLGGTPLFLRGRGPGEKRKQVEDTDIEIAGPPLQAQKVTPVFPVGSGLHPPVVNQKEQSDDEVIDCDLASPTHSPRAPVQENKLNYLPNQSGLLQELEKQRIALEELKTSKQRETEDLFIALQKKTQQQEESQKEIQPLRSEVVRKSNEQAYEDKRRQSAVTAPLKPPLKQVWPKLRQR